MVAQYPTETHMIRSTTTSISDGDPRKTLAAQFPLHDWRALAGAMVVAVLASLSLAWYAFQVVGVDSSPDGHTQTTPPQTELWPTKNELEGNRVFVFGDPPDSSGAEVAPLPSR